MKTLLRPSLRIVSCYFALCFAQSAYAEDVGCKAVFNAMLRITTTAYHSYTSLTLVPGTTPSLSQQINTGKAIYLLSSGKWIASSMTPAQMREAEEQNIKNAKTVCRVIREETIDGSSTTLYSVHEELDGSVADSQLWISKASGLPVHIKADTFDSRYDYSGVAAPAVHQ